MTIESRRRPRVVVVGGGFAGLAAVRQLSVADVDVLLIDRNGYNTFQPLLYQVATGGLNPGDVTFALRAFTSRFRNADFLRGAVTKVDADAKVVHLDQHEPIEYDYLVVACGVTANYFGIPGAQEHALAIYTRAGAIATRDRVLTAIENANQKVAGAPEPTIVVVGGGATGVEMAGALAELRNAAVPIAYRQLDPQRVRIILVEMVDHVLGPFHPKLRAYAAKQLRKRGVELRLSTSLKEVREDCVMVEGPGGEQDQIECAVVVWATGITAGPIVGGWGLPTGRGGRIEVGADLRVAGHPEVFAVGDVALDPEGLAQVAQPAIQGGKHAGVQIRRLLAGAPTEPFKYFDKGTMATIGRSDAVVQFPFGLRLRGLVAWLAWLGLHIIELMGGRNRLATLINLSVRYFSWPRSLNIVVGDPAD
ncbi:NAD(P)/FAD-dependent oxidoreductase [Angustibacter sp. McL0619]|uniref:NAD(P)/FAD-dependent oxidoreductase n=1 Tax=Angustibacter sp. McL0619 TaxID=3415676 RepID=UPI003CF743D7